MPTDPKKVPRRDPALSAVEYVSLVNETTQQGFERLATAQERTELALAQLTAQVRELAKQQQRTADNLDRHLELAEQQATNIAELTKLCTVLASRAG